MWRSSLRRAPLARLRRWAACSARQRQVGLPGLTTGPERQLERAADKPEPVTDVDDGKHERERRRAAEARLASRGERARQHGSDIPHGGGTEYQAGPGDP